ncbi:MAG: hypothetical protein U1E65_08485 [Myxococcota bacterium]
MTPARGPTVFSLCLGLIACSSAAPTPENPWKSGVSLPNPTGLTSRGFLDKRGLIHAHSIYSHDACDNMPVKDGMRDQVCLEDFRRGICQSMHDFVMLTDHPTSYGETEYPETMLYRPERGDVLIQRNGAPVANRSGCPDGRTVLIVPGMEGGVMPVGMEKHLFPPGQRDYYGQSSTVAMAHHHEVNALVLAQHTEDWTPEDLVGDGFDGFEMYNLHANTLRGAGAVIELLFRVSEMKPGLPAPDLAVLPIWSEDERYISTWGSVLSRGAHKVTTMGTDCHRNTFPALLSDGERIDSYRRMMVWFSNHVLVRPGADGSFDDQALKDALKAGRSFGVLEAMGFEEGFDFYAEAAGVTHEMGERLPFGASPKLTIKRPSVRELDTKRPAPEIVLRLLRAKEGGFDEVANAAVGDLSFTVTSTGAYRAEVRMVPHHLEADLGDFKDDVLAKNPVWIYSNAIYIE